MLTALIRPQGAALLAVLLLQGCGSAEVFGKYDIPESPDVANAPYPRLVDTPTAPMPGVYTAQVPDPANGTAIIVDLGAESTVAARRAAILANPVLSDAERLRLLRQTR